ncbi:hypothetical protein EJ05DRAFT_329080 [Pseudovirgaria hyperparasitica]|uniref:Cyclin-domain-containing protein n=1 Tax=Pseudovirgaria hyperparasitica TaxID=470096 RepID=A0A6A6W824_9PEZI|nr:uncharacterized protein EJ05DRAFT_329080 [Pseudovirgaria hyperparasitica]KAF2759002.1 hypothetical protein EJ05DRAFT_329080 [Pseudovirgaria hyperparasitica]
MLSMPHAVGRTPFDTLSHRSKQDQILLPLPKSSSIPPFSQSTAYSRPPLTTAPPTPPTDMNFHNTSLLPSYAPPNAHTHSDANWGNGRGMEEVISQAGMGPGTCSFRPVQEVSNSSSSQYVASGKNHSRKSSNNEIAPSLQIPDTIKTPQSGMPQLAAEITCLFWFESSATLQEVLHPTSPRKRPIPLCPEAMPSTGFRKWVATILSTTQVTPNVILLALMFVYRLKKSNPTVKGKLGSEYRLLTVALMLGNKFLDDNTYTNKTWAEVSGISVTEVHVMEVEFLSNMRYSLFTSEKQWNEWHVTLGKFGTFFDRASRVNMELAQRLSGPSTPTLLVPPTLPTPPTSSCRTSPPFGHSQSPNHKLRNNTPLLYPQTSSTAISPIGPLPEQDFRPNGRKRSYDDASQAPPPKRLQHQYHPTNIITNPGSTAQMMPTVAAPTLPRLPNLSIPLGQSLQSLSVPQLPPPGNRAMSLVYPPPNHWSQPQMTPMPTTTTSGPVVSQVPSSSMSVHEQSRQLSPFPGSANGSPNSVHFPASRLSPSYYLQQRQSPYRPVRHVHTLLHPPPSASMHNPNRSMSNDQMHYQPLGRPLTERRAGTLPYMHHEAWPVTNQFNQFPVLPQPDFSRV